jgi:hypothetical protein
MFNDSVQMGFFDVYDQYLLNILYDPRIRPGMTRDEVSALMPALLASARAWVGGVKPPDRASLPDGSDAANAAAARGTRNPSTN